jgi:glycine/sarcosine N-methyltransferase
MAEKVLSFYEGLADYYHLIFEDWDLSIQRQARVLGLVISQELPGQHLRILDCACGIGTQSLGLAAQGHHLVGCDLSPAEVRRATREAEQRGLDIEFHVSDMTDLKEISQTGFDVVSAFDNALPHLTSNELITAVGAMASKLKPGGLFIASIRDYDLLLQHKPAMQEPAFFGDAGSRRIIHQVWDWTDTAAYTLHLYLTTAAAIAACSTNLRRSESLLRARGFGRCLHGRLSVREPVLYVVRNSGPKEVIRSVPIDVLSIPSLVLCSGWNREQPQTSGRARLSCSERE